MTDSLSTIHHYIHRIKPKQSYCIICNQKKRLDLASINHTYTKNPEDYLWLCRSCHRLFDQTQKRLIKMPEKLETMVIYIVVPTKIKEKVMKFRLNALKRGIQLNEREAIIELIKLLDNSRISELLLKKILEGRD